jgi:Domain of unknown function (DUF4920)
MKRIKYFITLFVLISACSLRSLAQDAQNFGDVKVDASKAIKGDQVAELSKKLVGNGTLEINDITLSGVVNEVCQAKGCWMTTNLSDGKSMTIKFKDYAFFMPKDCSGKTFIAHGKIFSKITSVKELKHLAEDAGKSKKEIAKIKVPKEEIRFEADGVILQ